MNEVFLSICIPTYNRALYLDQTLNSIIVQEVFVSTNEIEIIISDNCSSDDTELISLKYVNLFPSKVKYFRNEENIHDNNFEKVLSLGKGCYLKLNNDTLIHRDGSLSKMIGQIKKEISTKPVIFFSNGLLGNKTEFLGCGLNDFISTVSFNTTWIALFGIWKEDFEKHSSFSKFSHLRLVQTDVLFYLINLKKKYVINNQLIFVSNDPVKKGGYDLITVFLDNYNFLLSRELSSGNISSQAYKEELRNLLLRFFPYWLTNISIESNQYSFQLNSPFQRINSFLKDSPLLLGFFYFKYIYMYIKLLIKKFTRM